MLDERGRANSGLVVLVVVLLVAIVAVLWLWGGDAAEDDVELEVDVGARPAAAESAAVADLPAPIAALAFRA